MKQPVGVNTRNQRINRQNQTIATITFQLPVIKRKSKVFEIEWFVQIYKQNNHINSRITNTYYGGFSDPDWLSPLYLLISMECVY